MHRNGANIVGALTQAKHGPSKQHYLERTKFQRIKPGKFLEITMTKMQHNRDVGVLLKVMRHIVLLLLSIKDSIFSSQVDRQRKLSA